MNLTTQSSPRKTARAKKFDSHAEPIPHGVRYILRRFEVSPSLARTIASLAMIGGR